MKTDGWTEEQIRGVRALFLMVALVRELSNLPLEAFLFDYERQVAVADSVAPGSFAGFHTTGIARGIAAILKAALPLKQTFLAVKAELEPCVAAQDGKPAN